MLESTNFTFDGYNSDDKGVVLVNTSGGLFNESFLPTRTLVETEIPHSYVRTLKKVARLAPSFSLTFYVEKWREWNNLRDIARWLDTDRYCEFWTDVDPERVYFLILEGDSSIFHNGCKDGYITLTFKSLYPYPLSPEYKEVDTVVSGSPLILHLDNAGDEDVRPNIKIRKIGDGDIKIINHQNGQEFIIENLLDGEEVLVDNENGLLRSSLEKSNSRYLYDSHNDVWLNFECQTDTQFEFIGDFEFEFSYRLIYKAETV